MERKEYLARKLTTIDVKRRSTSDLLRAMGGTGFQGRSLAQAVDVMEAMLRDPDTTIFLGYAGSMSTTGQWKIVQWMVENRYVDVLVSTGANISEDIFEAMGFTYFQGSHLADDADLLEQQIDRYYDVYADELDYRKLERFIYAFLETLPDDRALSSAEFLHLFGHYQLEHGVESISATAARVGVPIFSPGMADSGYGVAAYLLYKEQGKRVAVDQFKDFIQLGEIGERSSTTSVVYVGGGVPKDTIQLVTVMVDLARGGEETYPHKYAVQVTTDSPQWGGLSGCTFEEAISWGKIDPQGTRAVCYCDATIALPLISQVLLERGPFERRAPELEWVFEDVEALAAV